MRVKSAYLPEPLDLLASTGVVTIDGVTFPVVNVNLLHATQHQLSPQTQLHIDKPVGDWMSASSPNFVAMATRVGPTTFCMVPLNRTSPITPW